MGAHKFYLGKVWQGILYLIFVWTWIPAIIGFIEGIIYLTKTDEEFQKRYVNGNLSFTINPIVLVLLIIFIIFIFVFALGVISGFARAIFSIS